jgi:hypothetical protein
MTQYYALRWFEIVKHSSSYSWLDLHECLSLFPKIEALKQEQIEARALSRAVPRVNLFRFWQMK